MDRRSLAIYGVFAVIVIFVLGGLVAIIGMGQFRADLNLLKLPEYFWFYRHNGYVMGWLLKGVLGVSAAGVLPWSSSMPLAMMPSMFSWRSQLREWNCHRQRSWT